MLGPNQQKSNDSKCLFLFLILSETHFYSPHFSSSIVGAGFDRFCLPDQEAGLAIDAYNVII